MAQLPDFTRNHEVFTRFYGLQGCFTGHLAARPDLLRAWLEALPPREPEAAESTRAVRIWRTARLSSARRRELSGLVMRAEARADEAAPLALWLLASVPVCTFLEMAAAPGSMAPALEAEAGDCHRQLLELRETLFLANYGLAKAAAKRRRSQDYAEMLGAASDGLLDAIDRYVPDGRAARFAYFAGYWIRYHMARQFQKSGSVVSFPVNQHRIGRRIHRYLASRESDGAPPSPAEVRQELRLGRAAYFCQQQRPQVVSLHGSGNAGPEAPAMELRLCDPAPEPADLLEQAEIAERLRDLLHAQAGPAARLMLAYVHGVGPLADAAEDYLAALQDLARARLAGGRPDGASTVSSDGESAFPGVASGEHRTAEKYGRKEYHASVTTG